MTIKPNVKEIYAWVRCALPYIRAWTYCAHRERNSWLRNSVLSHYNGPGYCSYTMQPAQSCIELFLPPAEPRWDGNVCNMDTIVQHLKKTQKESTFISLFLWAECSNFSPGVSVLLLIFLCLEAILFLTFTAVMFGTQIHSICNDETVSIYFTVLFFPTLSTWVVIICTEFIYLLEGSVIMNLMASVLLTEPFKCLTGDRAP